MLIVGFRLASILTLMGRSFYQIYLVFLTTQTIESVWSLLDRSIIGAFHKVSVKHLPRYLDEIEFRFNGRDNPFLFRDTLMVLLQGDPMPYRTLVHG